MKRLSHKSNVVTGGDGMDPMLDAVRRYPPELPSVSRPVQCATRLHKDLLKPSGVNKKYHRGHAVVLKGEVSKRYIRP